ncbi:MAG: hypothetical protein ABR600_10750 [Actinomycetota bacterium]
MAKNLPVEHVTCTECGSEVEAAPKLNFLGLYRFECPRCEKAFLYPMSARRRKAYLGLSIFFGLVSVAVFLKTGAAPIPGVLPVLIALGLYRDSKVRRKVMSVNDEPEQTEQTEEWQDADEPEQAPVEEQELVGAAVSAAPAHIASSSFELPAAPRAPASELPPLPAPPAGPHVEPQAPRELRLPIPGQTPAALVEVAEKPRVEVAAPPRVEVAAPPRVEAHQRARVEVDFALPGERSLSAPPAPESAQLSEDPELADRPAPEPELPELDSDDDARRSSSSRHAVVTPVPDGSKLAAQSWTLSAPSKRKRFRLR